MNKTEYYPMKIDDMVAWLKDNSIENYHIATAPHNQLVVHVTKSVIINSRGLTHIPVQFGVVEGDFMCQDNQLVTLKGSPSFVSGNFYCFRNKLTTLEHSPKTIHQCFDCGYNQLTTLAGAPTIVKKSFYCYHNQLISLKGHPETINERFDFSNNNSLSLKYSDIENINCRELVFSMAHAPEYLKLYQNAEDKILISPNKLKPLMRVFELMDTLHHNLTHQNLNHKVNHFKI